MNTKVNIAGVELKNPVMTASGTFGSGAEYGEIVDLNRLGAVVTKGVANVPWPGNPTPRIAEVYVPVHKAGRHRQSGGIIHRTACWRIQPRTQLPDHAVIPDQDIHLCVDVGIRVKYPSVSDQKHVCFPLFPRYVYSQSSSIWIWGMPSSRNSSDTCRKPAFSYSPRA